MRYDNNSCVNYNNLNSLFVACFRCYRSGEILTFYLWLVSDVNRSGEILTHSLWLVSDVNRSGEIDENDLELAIKV